ncbi:protein of unknown function [Burkholderia multivorans]
MGQAVNGLRKSKWVPIRAQEVALASISFSLESFGAAVAARADSFCAIERIEKSACCGQAAWRYRNSFHSIPRSGDSG